MMPICDVPTPLQQEFGEKHWTLAQFNDEESEVKLRRPDYQLINDGILLQESLSTRR
jgi:hypothetical protein